MTSQVLPAFPADHFFAAVRAAFVFARKLPRAEARSIVPKEETSFHWTTNDRAATDQSGAVVGQEHDLGGRDRAPT
jgi:hypothetical protein